MKGHEVDEAGWERRAGGAAMLAVTSSSPRRHRAMRPARVANEGNCIYPPNAVCACAPSEEADEATSSTLASVRAGPDAKESSALGKQ